MKKLIPAIAFFFMIAGVLSISGCSKKAPPPPAEKITTNIEDKVLSVSKKLEEARALNAEDSWEYQEAESLFEQAKQLISEGKTAEAEELLAKAEMKATQALGAAREGSYMEGFGEEAQEVQKSLLRDAFSGENILSLPVSDVFFEFDSAALPLDAADTVDSNVSVLKENMADIKFIVIFGFCDVRGTDEYNLALGKKRADEIKKYMIGRGIAPEMVHSISKGETEIWQEGFSEEAYRSNRRGHFIILAKDNP